MYQWLQLWQEIQAQGYQGSAQTIYRYLRGLRKKRRVIWKPEIPQAPVQDFSAHEAVWLFARAPDSLEEKEQETLTAICQASETARTTYQLIQEFRQILHHREGEKLDSWLAKSAASQIRELQSFVQGIERDKAAVVAGLTLSQNNGLVEGHVNKLKLIERFALQQKQQLPSFHEFLQWHDERNDEWQDRWDAERALANQTYQGFTENV